MCRWRRRCLIRRRDKFDLAAAHELRLDHSLTVPLHFLNPGMRLPVVPIYTNGFASPLPLATRCVALGRMVRRFIDAWEGKERIALIASGCFAMDVGGPLRLGRTEWAKSLDLWDRQYQKLQPAKKTAYAPATTA